mmetsp:Transcript_25773/g.61046  ORF Transcript_25773/g.61046 Transcript_25773/m.61046 type:complete len:118 (+) Transcript_25773:314-667(+)
MDGCRTLKMSDGCDCGRVVDDRDKARVLRRTINSPHPSYDGTSDKTQKRLKRLAKKRTRVSSSSSPSSPATIPGEREGGRDVFALVSLEDKSLLVGMCVSDGTHHVYKLVIGEVGSK